MDLNPPVLPPLSLYLHLPWCVRKCPYCDFNSWTLGADAPLDRYVAALCRDLVYESRRAAGRELISVFIGGGTPSVFSPEQVATILGTVDSHFRLAADAEITMEANPGTVECGSPAGYRAAGVNRLSIGAQSLSAASLEALGRIHGVDDIRRSTNDARRAGFDNINLDIMYGLPGQDVAAAAADLEAAMALEPTHISWYQLTLEPNTVFHARPPAGLPGSDAAYDIQARGEELLAAAGFEQYEVSAYARDGRRCRHNLNYWTFGDYLAAGAGAHGKVSAAGAIRRYAKPAHPRTYMETLETGADAAQLVDLRPEERLFEFMLNVLRLRDSFGAGLFTARTGLPVSLLYDRLEKPIAAGLIEAAAAESWRVTDLGRRFLNDLQGEFLPE